MMKKPKVLEQPDYAELRKLAEEMLYKMHHGIPRENEDIKTLFQELQVHQIELEMQNDELRKANLELEKQRIKFSGIYDIAPVSYFILDKFGMILDVNTTGARLLEKGKSQIVNFRLQTFITSEKSDEYYKFFMHMLRSRSRQQCDVRLRTHSGRIIDAELQGIAISVTDEHPIECYIAVVDISERIKTEHELAEIMERLELSLKASLAGTWELNLKTMEFFMDESSQKICNIIEHQFDGKFQDFIELIHPDDRKKVEREFRIALTNHKEIDLICRFGAPGDKECYTVIRGHLISDSEPQKRFVGIIMDITEKTQMERYSSRMKNEYQKKIASATLYTQENERKRISDTLHDSVSQLLYGVKIKLRQFGKNKPTATEMSDINKLLDQAIEETRNISFELAPSILTDFGLLVTIEELAKRLSSKNLTIKAKVTGFHKRSDILKETNIYRIVQELVNNSMKHAEATEIKIQLIENKVVEIIIQDNGKGYDVKEQERSPSGSGLSSIKNRLSLYNGSLDVVSEPGRGTTVHVKLN